LDFFAAYFGVLAWAHFVSGWPWPQAQIAGIALSTTSVAVVYAVMVETGFNDTENRQGHPGSLLHQRHRHGAGARAGLRQLQFLAAGSAGATVFALLLLPRVTPWFFARLGARVSEPQIKFVLVILFLLGGLANTAKSEAVLPAYLIGMVLAPVFLGDR
jgi:Kef-type K+ transport system membrane component KefB